MKSVRIYTKSVCPYCVRAKKLFDLKKVPYEEISIEGKQDEAEALFAKTGFRTVPQIFIGETCIGGCDNLYDLEREGRLDGMLA